MQTKPHPPLGPRYELLLLLGLAFLVSVTRLHAADTVVAVNSASAPTALAAVPDAQPNPTGPSGTSQENQTVPLSDQDITRAILTELLEARDRSVAKKIKIQVSRGKVTLSGLAKNEKQQKEIVAIASRAVGATNVEDKIQLRTKK